MAQGSSPGKPALGGLKELRIRLGADAKRRPTVAVLFSDGRSTQFRETAIVVPDDAGADDDPRGGDVYAVLVNGRGEVLFEAATGEPVILQAVPMVLRFEDRPDPDKRLSYADVASKAGVSKSTVQRAVYSGDLPKPDKLSARRVAFRQGDILEWLDLLGRQTPK